jgi:hypothetical protein
MWDTLACTTAIFLAHVTVSIAVLENVPLDAGLQKILGLAGTGNQTRATCVASSGNNRSAIHYALRPGMQSGALFLFPFFLLSFLLPGGGGGSIKGSYGDYLWS